MADDSAKALADFICNNPRMVVLGVEANHNGQGTRVIWGLNGPHSLQVNACTDDMALLQAAAEISDRAKVLFADAQKMEVSPYHAVWDSIPDRPSSARGGARVVPLGSLCAPEP